MSSNRYDFGLLFVTFFFFVLIPQLLGKGLVKTLLDWIIFLVYIASVFGVTYLWYLQFTGEDRETINWALVVVCPILFLIFFVKSRRKK